MFPRRPVSGFVQMSEVSTALGIPRSTVYWKCRAKELPVQWIAGRYVMARKTLERLVRERQAKQETPAA